MNGFNVVSRSLVGDPGTTWQLPGDGGAAYRIGSGYTIPLSGSSTTPATGTASLSTGDSLASAGRFGIFAPALPTHLTIAR